MRLLVTMLRRLEMEMMKCRTKYALVNPVYVVNVETGEELTIPAGHIIELCKGGVSARRQASLASYWCELKSYVDSLPEGFQAAFTANLIQDAAIQGGVDVELMHALLKKIYGIESVAFHKLEEDEFQKYKQFALQKMQMLTGADR